MMALVLSFSFSKLCYVWSTFVDVGGGTTKKGGLFVYREISAAKIV